MSEIDKPHTIVLPFLVSEQFDDPIPRHVLGNPFFDRIQRVIADWIASEHESLAAIVQKAGCKDQARWTKEQRNEYVAARLTVDTLVWRLDRMSESSLRRELKLIGAPGPGDLIRIGRLTHAARLLRESRMAIREVAGRAGYEDLRHFSDQFVRFAGVTPSDYRRSSAGTPHVAGGQRKPTRRADVIATKPRDKSAK